MKNKFTLSIAFLLFICTSVKLNAQTSKIQIVHNSPDITIDTVDVWCDNVKIANDLLFRKATTLITVDSGDHVITISQRISTDTTTLFSLLRVEGFRVDTSKNYLAFITGVVDTTLYATSPNGSDRSLSFVSIDTYKTTGTATQVDLSFFNGTPDAAAWDLNEIGLPGLVKVGDDIGYNAFSAKTTMTAANTIFNFTSADSSVISAAYKLNMSVAGFKAATTCIFTSGVIDTVANPASTKRLNFYAVLNNGSVVALTKLVSEIQFVHNSPDVTNDSIDVYIDGVLAYDNFAYRTATPFIAKDALVSHSIAIAPKTSASIAEAFYTLPLTLDSVNYYVIAHGVLNPAQYVANPNGKNISFMISTYKGARKVATTASKNVDLLYFHGGTDLQTTTCRGEDQSQFLSKDDSYGAFHGYGAHTSLDNIVMMLRDAVSDSILYTGVANLSIGQGKGGLVFLSGFSNDTLNQGGDTLIMFVAWPDGNVDSIAIIKEPTGISENLLGNVKVSVFPNPANDQFTINMTTQKKTTLAIAVTDITGRVVYESTNALSSGENNVSINTAAYQTGMYFVTLSANGESLTQKVSIIK